MLLLISMLKHFSYCNLSLEMAQPSCSFRWLLLCSLSFVRHLAKLAEIHPGEEGITIFLPLCFGSELKVPLCNAELCCPILSDSLQPCGLEPTSLLCPWRSSRQEYWHALLRPPQGTFPTQGLNPGLLHCRQILYHLSYQASPKVLLT